LSPNDANYASIEQNPVAHKFISAFAKGGIYYAGLPP
tara:strand:- start:301 stop:411 length:111 start_codon:yes stop_codon:yes gene_type:complete